MTTQTSSRRPAWPFNPSIGFRSVQRCLSRHGDPNSMQVSLDTDQNCPIQALDPAFRRRQLVAFGTSRGVRRSHRDKANAWRLDDGTWCSSLDDRYSTANHSGDLAVWRTELKSSADHKGPSLAGRSFALRRCYGLRRASASMACSSLRLSIHEIARNTTSDAMLKPETASPSTLSDTVPKA